MTFNIVLTNDVSKEEVVLVRNARIDEISQFKDRLVICYVKNAAGVDFRNEITLVADQLIGKSITLQVER